MELYSKNDKQQGVTGQVIPKKMQTPILKGKDQSKANPPTYIFSHQKEYHPISSNSAHKDPIKKMIIDIEHQLLMTPKLILKDLIIPFNIHQQMALNKP